MTDDRLDKLESRVAELEAFKENAERFFRDYSLRRILYKAGDAIHLTSTFEENQPGYYCKKCFLDTREFHPVERKSFGFQQGIGESLKNAVCVHCGSATSIGTDTNPLLRDFQ